MKGKLLGKCLTAVKERGCSCLCWFSGFRVLDPIFVRDELEGLWCSARVGGDDRERKTGRQGL